MDKRASEQVMKNVASLKNVEQILPISMEFEKDNSVEAPSGRDLKVKVGTETK